MLTIVHLDKIMFLYWPLKYFYLLRGALHGGGGPCVCEVTRGGSPHLS